MPQNITDVYAFTSPVVAPDDGDAATAASVLTGLQGLANRTKYLNDLTVKAVSNTNNAIVISANTTNTDCINATGNGLGSGIVGNGGASNGVGVLGTGGGGSGTGVYGYSLLYGVHGDGDTGVLGEGDYLGGRFVGPGDGTSSNDDAIESEQNIHFSGLNPAKSTGFINRLTPSNIPKAWGSATGNGATAPSVNTNGFNCAISRHDTQTLRVDFIVPMADADYVVVFGNSNSAGVIPTANSRAATHFFVSFYDASGVILASNSGWRMEFVTMGFQ